MNETQLLRIALLVGISGIICLFLLSKTIEAQKINIDEITGETIGKKVVIEGTVQEVKHKKDITILIVKQEQSTNTISVVVFSKNGEENDREDSEDNIVREGQNVIVSGTVKDYYGVLEIIAENIIN